MLFPKGLRLISILSALALLACLSSACIPQDAEWSRGLDCWEDGLLHGSPLSGNLGDAFGKIAGIYAHSPGFDAFLSRSCSAFAHRYGKAEDYLLLEKALIGLRDEVRKKPKTSSVSQANELALIADSVLYALRSYFPHQLQVFTLMGEVGTDSTGPDCRRSYFGVRVCDGDVMISKSSTFSSSLFELRSPFQYAYSHADLLVNGARPQELLALTADPGTTGLMDPIGEEMPARIAIYRPKAREPGALGSFLSFQGKKPVARRKMEFNYALRPGCGGPAYYCTQLVYCAYEKAAVNPYPRSLWTEADPGRSDFLRSLGFPAESEAIPAPGDVEFNPRMERVFYLVQLDQLPEIRVQYVATKIFLRWMREDQALKALYMAALDRWSRAKTTDYASFLRKQRFAGVAPREVYFYAHFQLRVLPDISAALSKKLRVDPLTLSELRTRIEPLLRSELEDFIRSAP